MSLKPDMNELLARARADLRIGVPVVFRGAGEMLLVVPTETLSPARMDAMRGLGALELAITARRAETLKARAYDGDVARVCVPADAGVDWVAAVADPKDDLAAPMKGPLATQREGAAELHRVAIDLCKAARLLPAVLCVAVRDAPEGLTVIDAAGARPAMDASAALAEIVAARVPIEVSENTRLHVFRPEDGSEEHYAVEIGRPKRDADLLVRLHSACFTGDLIGSLKCDCGPQLRGALKQMGEEGAGVLLYLNQEGRGIGLANKMRAYSLQDQGFDTVEANHRLGFEDDERDFRVGSAILKEMGFSKLRLMTNNPGKIAMMEKQGLTVVERVPLIVGHNEHNRDYLKVKARKSGHML